ncbi:MAG: TonB-dependent receptor [Acidobacteriota bacterium]
MVRITLHSILIFFIATLFVMLLLPGTIEAQSTSASLEGTIWDPSDNATPGVILTAVEENSGWQSEAVSDENGRYLFLALRPGYYTIYTRARGYQQVTRRHIYLPVNGSVIESFTLDITAADETVGTEERVPVDSSDIHDDLSPQDLAALPVFSRNPLILTADFPGIQSDGAAKDVSTANGARRGMNHVSIDGLAVSDPVNPKLATSSIAINPDSVQTVHLITSGATAEFGRAAGAQIGIVSRSGGNSWHGNVFDYIGNKSLNANDFYNNAAGNERPNFRRNIFGGTVSGPLMANRTLIFGNYEGRRMGSQIRRNRLVLMDDSDDDIENDEAKSGVFQWITPGANELQSFDIVANDPRNLGIDPQVAGALAVLPSPNNTLIGDGRNTGGYQFINPTHSNADQMTVRIDHTLNSNHRIYVRFNWSRTDATDVLNNADPVFHGTVEGTFEETTWALAAGSHFTLNPRMINELRIGYVRHKTDLNRPARSSGSMLLANSWTDPLDPDSSRAYISPYGEISDTFAHSMNRHTFKYGATVRRTEQKRLDYAGVYPDITFGNSMGNAPAIGPMGNTVISDEDRQTFENLYNDLLGRVESVTQTYHFDLTSPQPPGSARARSFSSYEYSAFIQDDWRILPNLTLNLGLRWEFFSVPHEENDLQRVLDPNSDISTTANISDFSIVAGDGWRNRNLSDFAPRVGFAWDITGYGSSVLRGSYGIYYDRPIGAITSFIDSNTYGFSQTVSTYPNIGGGDVRLRDEFPYPSAPAAPDLTLPVSRSASIAILDPNLHTPRVDRFNLTLERRMSDHLVFEASYVRSRGRRLYQNLNYNQTKTEGDFLQAFQEVQAYRDFGTPVSESNTLVQIFGSPIAVLDAVGGYYFDSGQAGLAADTVDKGYYDLYSDAGVSDFYLRNYPQFDQFIVGTDSGRSWYDALQAGFRANSDPFSMRFYYTWGKSIDTLSMDGAEFVSPSDSLNPGLNKSFSDFDRNHIFNISSSFNVPVGRNRRYGSEMPSFMDWVLGDWEIGFLSVWQSGQRFSVSSGRETLFPGVISLADYNGIIHNIGELFYRPDGVYWFDPELQELFTYPEAGEMGTSGRNWFRGPNYFNVDLTFFKPFQVGDNNRFLIRAEIYNLFNKSHFGVPNTNIFENSFAKFTSTIGTPRMIQLALRYEF